jgi:hypothetical protein
MGFFKKFKKYILPVAGAALGSVIPGVGTALGASLGAGAASYSSNHDPLSALLSAGGTYAGSALGGDLLGTAIPGTVRGTLTAGLGDGIGGTLASGLGSLAGTSLASLAGGSIGGSLAESLTAPKPKAIAGNANIPAPFKPTRAEAGKAPLNLGGLTEQQQASNIASGGVYGGGQGPDEQSYFLNLMNRRLVDESGNVDTDFRDIGGVENSYLAQLGLGNKKNPTDLLSAISSWRA